MYDCWQQRQTFCGLFISKVQKNLLVQLHSNNLTTYNAFKLWDKDRQQFNASEFKTLNHNKCQRITS